MAWIRMGVHGVIVSPPRFQQRVWILKEKKRINTIHLRHLRLWFHKFITHIDIQTLWTNNSGIL